MARMVFGLAISLLFVGAAWGQVSERKPDVERWSSNLIPPRLTLHMSWRIESAEGKIRTNSPEPADNPAYLGWVEHRLKKSPSNLELYKEKIDLLLDFTGECDARVQATAETALRLVAEELQQAPNKPELLAYEIRLLRLLKQNDQSCDKIRKLVRQHPQYLRGLIFQNQLLYGEGKYQEALEDARRLAATHGNDADAWLNLVNISRFEWNRRLQALIPDLKLTGDVQESGQRIHSEYIEQLVKCRGDVEGTKKAESEYAAFVKQVEECYQANEKARQTVLQDELQHHHLWNIVAMELTLNELRTSLTGKTIQQDRSQVLAKKEQELKAILAEMLRRQDDPGILAMAAFSLTMKILSKVAEFHSEELKQTGLTSSGLTPETAKRLAELIKKHYSSEAAIHSKIIAILKRLAQVDFPPMAAMAEHHLGVCLLLSSGDFNEVLTHFNNSLQLDPTRRNTFANYLGCAANLKLKFSWDQLPEAVRRHHDDAESHALCARSILNSEVVDEKAAWLHVEAALKHDPTYPLALLTKACLLARRDRKKGTLEEAAAVCQRARDAALAVQADAKLEVEYYLIAGSIDMLRDLTSSAQSQFTEGLKVYPNDETLKKALEICGSIVPVEGSAGK